MHPKDPTCALRVVGFGIVVRTSPFCLPLFQFFLRIDVMHATDTNTILLNLGIKYKTETNYCANTSFSNKTSLSGTQLSDVKLF